MCFTPFPPMRQRAVLFPVSHRPASAIMHNSTSNTNPLGSPPRKAHCRLLAIDLSHGGQCHTTPSPALGVLPCSPCPPLVNCSLLHITRNPRSLRCRPIYVRVRVCRRRGEEEEEEEEGKPARAFSLGTTLAAHFLQLSSPQNLAIKTPSPRPQLHRKRNTFGLGPARRVHFRWTSNIRPKPPCARRGPSPTVTTKTPTVRTTAAVEKMAKGPARDSGGLCLYRKHYALPNR